MQHLAEIHDDHGERVTVPQRRTGWLDRELDYETAPGHVRHKLYDLDHRKYDGATAQFLSVDPLWSMFISSGSYVYCTGDAINNVDPWGLGEEGTSPLIPLPSKPKVPCSPMVIGHGDETLGGSLWTYEILFGQYLRKLGATGDGMGPQGNGPGVSVLTPPGGIGPGGKGGVKNTVAQDLTVFNSSQLTSGVANIGLGVVGVIASGGTIAATEGMAAPLAWTLFTSSLASISIGITKVVDAFANPVVPTPCLRNADNIPGLVAYGVGSPYAWRINSGVNVGTSMLGGAPLLQLRTIRNTTSLYRRVGALGELGEFLVSGSDFVNSIVTPVANRPPTPNSIRIGTGGYILAYP